MKLMTKRPAVWMTRPHAAGFGLRDCERQCRFGLVCEVKSSISLTSPLSESDHILLRRSLADRCARGQKGNIDYTKAREPRHLRENANRIRGWSSTESTGLLCKRYIYEFFLVVQRRESATSNSSKARDLDDDLAEVISRLRIVVCLLQLIEFENLVDDRVEFRLLESGVHLPHLLSVTWDWE
jgi:hypothetical protein